MSPSAVNRSGSDGDAVVNRSCLFPPLAGRCQARVVGGFRPPFLAVASPTLLQLLSPALSLSLFLPLSAGRVSDSGGSKRESRLGPWPGIEKTPPSNCFLFPFFGFNTL